MKTTSLILGLIVSPIFLISALPASTSAEELSLKIQKLKPELRQIAKEDLHRIASDPSHVLSKQEIVAWAQKTLRASMEEMLKQGKLTVEESQLIQTKAEVGIEALKNTDHEIELNSKSLLAIRDLRAGDNYWEKWVEQWKRPVCVIL